MSDCHSTSRWSAALLLCALSIGSAHAACSAGVTPGALIETTPSADFVPFGAGTVAHLKTGLVWKRCAEGQTWNGSACDGTATLQSWSSALQASVAASDDGATDWRVPNRKELESIIEFCGFEPAINQTEFPKTPSERFWTSTTFVDEPNRAWDVYFSDGYSGASNKTTNLNAVRLVRTAPAGSLLQAQSISFGALPAVSVGATAQLAVAASSGLPVELVSNTPTICSVAGVAVTGLSGGVCTLGASQAGDAAYYPAPVVTADLAVSKLLQTIEVGSVTSPTVGGTVVVNATASSGLPVALSVTTPAVCTLTGNQLVGVAAGSCSLLAEQSGNDMFAPAAPVSRSVEVQTATSGGSGGGDGEAAPPELIGYAMRLGGGWHLLGNSLNSPIVVAEYFADRQVVESVWTWNAETRRWAFFTPQFNAQALNAYTRSRDLDLLAAINPGEGYWLKLKRAHDFGEQRGEPATVALNNLAPGWHLITLGKAVTPAELNRAMAAAGEPGDNAPPVAGAAPGFVSLWSFNNAKGRWMFYSPELDAQGEAVFGGYRESKGYLDFTAEQQTLGEGRGFWLKK